MAEMFTEVARPTTRVGAKRWYTVPLSIVAHAGLFAVLIVVPLLATGVLPTSPSVMVFTAPPPPTMPETPRAPTPPPASTPVTPAATPPSGPPTEAPASIQPEAPSFAIGVTGIQGMPPGLIGVTGASGLTLGTPAPMPIVVSNEPLRPGGQIKEPIKMHDVLPAYPPFAVRAKVSGFVIIEATIGVDGRVTDAKVLRSIPLLDEAALAAVRQWRYRPTLLNGVPVAILMTVTVNFALK